MARCPDGADRRPERAMRRTAGVTQSDEPGAAAGASPQPTPPVGGKTLAQKLDALFRTMSPRGREYSYKEVADAINARSGETGVKISHGTIWNLRSGKTTTPRAEHLQALADFFKVPLGYFLDEKVAADVE